jgi:hypothetical protein
LINPLNGHLIAFFRYAYKSDNCLDSNLGQDNLITMFSCFRRDLIHLNPDIKKSKSYSLLHILGLFLPLILLNLIPQNASSQDVEQQEEVLHRKAEYYIMIMSDIIMMERFGEKIKNPTNNLTVFSDSFFNEATGKQITEKILNSFPAAFERHEKAKEYLTQLISGRPEITKELIKEASKKATANYRIKKLRKLIIDAKALNETLKKQGAK